MPKKLRCVIYTRVSTPKQEFNYSLRTQLKKCREYASRQGWDVIAEYSDKFTGTKVSRPEFDKVRALSGTFEILLVYVLDRLGRLEPLPFWNMCKSFQENGTKVWTTEDGWINADDLIAVITPLFKSQGAFDERKKIVRRGRDGRREAAEKDHKITISRLGKYGYDYSKKRRKLTINPEETKWVKRIYEWYTEGDPDQQGKKIGMIAIARKLTELRIPTKADTAGKPKKKGYGVWGSSSVRVILTDETYAGRWYFGRSRPGDTPNTRKQADKKDRICVPCPPIVSEDTFQAAQARARANYIAAPRNTKSEYLMRARLTCGVCGKQFSCTIDTRRKVPRQIYYCGGQRARGSLDGLTHQCSGDLSADVIDAAVWRAVVNMLREPESILDSLSERQLAKEAEIRPERDSLTRYQAEHKRLTERRQWVLDAYLNGTHEKAWLESNLKNIESVLVELQDKIKDQELRLAQVDLEMIRPDDIRQYCEDASRGLDLLDYEHRRNIIDALEIKGVVCRGETPKDLMIALSCLIPGLEIAAEFAPIPT